ncbi:MAG: (Fe-S)-binding protein [bacterium]
MDELIKTYEIKSIDNIVCLPGTGILRLYMTVDKDLTDFLPYINGYVKKARYLPTIGWIRFPFVGFPSKRGSWNVAIKGNEIIIAKFNNSEEAKETAKELIEYLNHLSEIKGSITPDYTEWNPPKVFDILSLLPRTNCKKCGFLSCMAFATKLAEGEADIEQCSELSEHTDSLKKLYALFEKK